MVENIETKFVMDASVIVSILSPDERLPEKMEKMFSKFLKRKIEFVAPTLLKYEVGNVLRSLVLKRRMDEANVGVAYHNFLKLEIRFVDIDYNMVLMEAISNKISFYDASYLFLSKKLKVKLLTLDKKLSQLC